MSVAMQKDGEIDGLAYCTFALMDLAECCGN